jgi:hypothetical protein
VIIGLTCVQSPDPYNIQTVPEGLVLAHAVADEGVSCFVVSLFHPLAVESRVGVPVHGVVTLGPERVGRAGPEDEEQVFVFGSIYKQELNSSETICAKHTEVNLKFI